jgi:hypothetical protein
MSRIPAELEVQLRRIASKVPFGIITSKDFDFVFPRTRFAKAWACVSGLDTRLSNGEKVSRPNLPDISEAYRRFTQHTGKLAFIEAKRNSEGRLLGFSIEWKPGERPPSEVLDAAFALKEEGLFVEHNDLYPFIDVFAGSPDKGKALRELRRILRINGNVMFIGDSRADKKAFQEADLAVGILHGQPVEELECEFVVEHPNLGKFLSALVESNMQFTPSLPYVSRRE